MGKSSNEPPKAPNYAKLYEQGIKLNMKYLPRQLAQELKMRQQYDPVYIQQALGEQAKYDPALAGQQLAALQRRDPEWLAMHRALGTKVSQALQRGYLDPLQQRAYEQMGAIAGQMDPQRAAAYKALGQQVTGDTLRGATADPATLRQMTQAILSRSPNLSYGEAQNMAAAVYTGQRGQALEQQRQQATQQFLQQATPMQQRQGSLAAFYGQAPPSMAALGLAGTYMQPSNAITSQINQIQGVTPPSANRYVNPNAGAQAAQFGLQNYQNVLGASQLNNQNPWSSALGTVGGIAGNVIGGIYGGPAGAAIGGYAGGAAGNYLGGAF
jgi:hypothetical protein